IGTGGATELVRRWGAAFALACARPEPCLVLPAPAWLCRRPARDLEAELKVKVTSEVETGVPLADLGCVGAPARALPCGLAGSLPLLLAAPGVEPSVVPAVLAPLEPAAGSPVAPVAPVGPVEPVGP